MLVSMQDGTGADSMIRKRRVMIVAAVLLCIGGAAVITNRSVLYANASFVCRVNNNTPYSMFLSCNKIAPPIDDILCRSEIGVYDLPEFTEMIITCPSGRGGTQTYNTVKSEGGLDIQFLQYYSVTIYFRPREELDQLLFLNRQEGRSADTLLKTIVVPYCQFTPVKDAPKIEVNLAEDKTVIDVSYGFLDKFLEGGIKPSRETTVPPGTTP